MTYRQQFQKYGAKRTTTPDGEKFDSKFEAKVYQDLLLRQRAGEIVEIERQFKVEIVPYTADGRPLPELTVRHRIDFRVQLADGTFELIEAKGLELADWKRRRKWLEALWLPQHPDHSYIVVKQRGGRRFAA